MKVFSQILILFFLFFCFHFSNAQNKLYFGLGGGINFMHFDVEDPLNNINAKKIIDHIDFLFFANESWDFNFEYQIKKDKNLFLELNFIQYNFYYEINHNYGLGGMGGSNIQALDVALRFKVQTPLYKQFYGGAFFGFSSLLNLDYSHNLLHYEYHDVFFNGYEHSITYPKQLITKFLGGLELVWKSKNIYQFYFRYDRSVGFKNFIVHDFRYEINTNPPGNNAKIYFKGDLSYFSLGARIRLRTKITKAKENRERDFGG